MVERTIVPFQDDTFDTIENGKYVVWGEITTHCQGRLHGKHGWKNQKSLEVLSVQPDNPTGEEIISQGGLGILTDALILHLSSRCRLTPTVTCLFEGNPVNPPILSSFVIEFQSKIINS